MKNREIKFRAWDKEKEAWLKPRFDGYLCVDNGCVVVVHYKPMANGTYAPDFMNQLPWDKVNNLEIMQYTNLKDKNGVEIYEGDIVVYELNKKKYRTEFLNGSFLLRRKETNIENLDFADCDYGLEVEVIGNIYENKELIK